MSLWLDPQIDKGPPVCQQLGQPRLWEHLPSVPTHVSAQHGTARCAHAAQASHGRHRGRWAQGTVPSHCVPCEHTGTGRAQLLPGPQAVGTPQQNRRHRVAQDDSPAPAGLWGTSAQVRGDTRAVRQRVRGLWRRGSWQLHGVPTGRGSLSLPTPAPSWGGEDLLLRLAAAPLWRSG